MIQTHSFLKIVQELVFEVNRNKPTDIYIDRIQQQTRNNYIKVNHVRVECRYN